MAIPAARKVELLNEEVISTYTSKDPKADSAAAMVGWPSPWIETLSPRSIRIELNP